MDITLYDLQTISTILIQGVLALLFIGGCWFALDKFTKFDDYREIVVNKNWSYLVQRLGILFAQTTGILACFNFSGRWSSVGMMVVGAIWVTVIVLVAYPLIERALGRTARLHEAHMDNMGVSLAKAAAYVGIGLVLHGSLSGSAPNGTVAIAATVVFTALGLMAVPTAVYLHNRGLKYNLTGETRDGKLSASLELAGVLLAMGILLRNAIAGDFVGWAPGLVGFGVTFGISLVLLYIYRVVADKVIFRHRTVNGAQHEDAAGPAALLAAILPITALVVSMVVTPIAGIFA